MSRSRAVAGGASILIGAQGVVTLAQIGTGAVTARFLSPSAFGTFAAALAITGLLGVLLTSATTTAVLREHELTPGKVWKLWAIAVVQGVLGAALTWLAAPAWATFYHSPPAEPMVRWLSIQVGLAPLAMTGSALLRREHRAFADAFTQAGSVVLGLVVGLVAVLMSRQTISLVVSPVVSTAGLLLSTMVLRRKRYSWVSPDRSWSIGRANTQIVLQNLFFFALSATPIWLVSLVANAHDLGLFSRALSIPSMVVGSVTVGLVRAVQPYYRSMAPEKRGATLRDVVVMAGAVGIPIMTLIAACSRPLITIWLGPDWVDGARFVPLIAAGSATYLIFTLLGNAAETLNYLAEVRFAQLAMLPALLAAALTARVLGSPQWAAATMLIVALPGLAALSLVLARRGLVELRGLLPAVGVQLGTGLVIGIAGWLSARVGEAWGNTASLLISATVVTVLYLITTPIRPEWGVIRSRGLLPQPRGSAPSRASEEVQL